MKRCIMLALIIVCFAFTNQLPSQDKVGTPGIVVNKEAKTVTIDAVMAPRVVLKEKKEPYPLEVIATWPHPKGKKAHETIVNFSEAIKPSDVHKALESLGIKAGMPVMGKGEAKGPAVNVYFLIPDSTGLERKVTLDRAMVDSKNGKPFPKNVEWRFTGSAQVQPDPSKNDKIFGADVSGTLMTIFPVTNETVFQTALSIEQEGIMKLEVNTKVMPKEGTRVKLVVEVKEVIPKFQGEPMKRFVALMMYLAIASPVAAQSASDKAAKRLADLVALESSSPALMPAQPIQWKNGKAVEVIELPIKPYAGLPARLPQTPSKEMKPSTPREGTPLVAYQDKTPSPAQVELPTQPLIRLPSLDLHTPLAMPILAQASKDRASLAEPAFEASLDAAMKRFTPVRDKPVPFRPLNLPDPFEFLRYGELRHPPSENPMPPAIPFTKPK